MSLFCAILSLDIKTHVDKRLKDNVLSNISRNEDKVIKYDGDNFFFAKIDINAYKEPAFIFKEGEYLAALTGDPILSEYNYKYKDRYSALNRICTSIADGNIDILKYCQGFYNFIYYDIKNNNLTVSTDKVGLRQIFYSIDDRYIYISGVLRLLEEIESIKRTVDTIGVAEELLLGYQLGRRSPYNEIKVLRGGEYVQVIEGKFNVSEYHRWDTSRKLLNDNYEMIQQVKERFYDAVRARSWREDNATCLISGGMDSRSVITCLWDLGKNISSYNFSPDGSQDAIFSREYAKHFGWPYDYKENTYNDSENFRFPFLISKIILNKSSEFINNIEYPNLVFSGDGGSVGLGHVYINDNILDAQRENNKNKTTDLFMSDKICSKYIFKKEIFDFVISGIHKDVFHELNRLNSHDPGRDYYIFLIDNNQRRHISYILENIDVLRMEYMLPFYDGLFLETVISTSIDYCLRHKLYTDMWDLFPKDILSTPWQTYPGHIECPIKTEKKYEYQWDQKMNNPDNFKNSQDTYKKLKKLFYTNRYDPLNIFNDYYVLSSIMLHGLKYKNFASEFKMLLLYENYYKKTINKK